jgi:Tol biopolymer transport system component
MTPDGRYVGFVSAANDLVAEDTNGIPDIFVRDLVSGTTFLASPGAAATTANAQNSSEAPVITLDGRYIAFYTTATNLVPGATNTAGEIFVRDLVGGITIWASTNAQAIVTIKPARQCQLL